MRDLWKAFVQFFVSLKLTVALLVLSLFLVFFATLDQTTLGIYAVQEKWFRSFVVIHFAGDIPLPVYPGGYFIGGLLLINLIASHFYRFRFSAKKSGIWLTHAGLIVLLLGELFTGLWQEDYQMRLAEGETRSYAEHFRENELVVIDTTDPQIDRVVAIPEKLLGKSAPLTHTSLPFRLQVKAYFPNADARMRDQVPNAPPSLATTGFGQRLALTPLPITYRHDDRNLPAAYIDVVAPTGSLGTFLVWTGIPQAETFTYEGKTWKLALRFTRAYHPFSIKLLKVTHDVYPGSEIPRNFSSRILLTDDNGAGREVLIYMNNPLRHDGLTFYQYQMDSANGSSTFQVVRNPSWTLPYIACAMMTLGLVIQFGLHLFNFVRKRRAPNAPPSTATPAQPVIAPRAGTP
jgi:hypothetical protein